MEVFKSNYMVSEEQRPVLKTYNIAVTSFLLWTALALRAAHRQLIVPCIKRSEGLSRSHAAHHITRTVVGDAIEVKK